MQNLATRPGFAVFHYCRDDIQEDYSGSASIAGAEGYINHQCKALSGSSMDADITIVNTGTAFHIAQADTPAVAAAVHAAAIVCNAQMQQVIVCNDLNGDQTRLSVFYNVSALLLCYTVNSEFELIAQQRFIQLFVNDVYLHPRMAEHGLSELYNELRQALLSKIGR